MIPNRIWRAIGMILALFLIAGCQTYKFGQEGLADAESKLGYKVVTPCYLPKDVSRVPTVFVDSHGEPTPAYTQVVYRSKTNKNAVVRFIQERDNMGDQVMRVGKRVTIEGNPAVISENGVSVSIGWIKGGYHFDLTSTGYSSEEIIKVVSSMMVGCPGNG